MLSSRLATAYPTTLSFSLLTPTGREQAGEHIEIQARDCSGIEVRWRDLAFLHVIALYFGLKGLKPDTFTGFATICGALNFIFSCLLIHQTLSSLSEAAVVLRCCPT